MSAQTPEKALHSWRGHFLDALIDKKLSPDLEILALRSKIDWLKELVEEQEETIAQYERL